MTRDVRESAERGGADHRAGFVAIVGRPNAGKSTLLNTLLGYKIAGVTPKPQTTRRRLLGIRTLAGCQLVFVDTPGIHAARDLMSERMAETAKQSLRDADVAVWLVDARLGLTEEDRQVAALLRSLDRPVVVALNKIDAVRKAELLPLIAGVADLLPGCQPIPLSALHGENLDTLLAVLRNLVPAGPACYPESDLTDETTREIAAELIREKVILETRQEVPYSTAVVVDTFEEKDDKNLVVIGATIHVEREPQKAIVIGRGGRRIKAIGQAARRDLERLVGRRVFLELFVRVQENWTKNAARLKDLGL